MLKIRLARHGRTHRPFFRVVLTEHIKPVKSGYQKVLGWYDPIKHTQELDIESVKKYIANGAKLSERVARLAYKVSNDDFFKTQFEIKNIQRSKKKEKKK